MSACPRGHNPRRRQAPPEKRKQAAARPRFSARKTLGAEAGQRGKGGGGWRDQAKERGWKEGRNDRSVSRSSSVTAEFAYVGFRLSVPVYKEVTRSNSSSKDSRKNAVNSGDVVSGHSASPLGFPKTTSVTNDVG